MRLLFDLTCTQPTGYHRETVAHGGAEYAKAVFTRLAMRPWPLEITGFYKDGLPLAPEISSLEDQIMSLVPVTGLDALPGLIAERKIDRVFCAEAFDLAGMNLGKVEFLGTVHGLRSLEILDDEFELIFRRSYRDVVRYWVKRLMRRRLYERRKEVMQTMLSISSRRKFFVSSNHTRSAFLGLFPEMKPDDLILAYCAPSVTVPCAPIDRLAQWGVQPGKFFLLNSANRWIKNAVRGVLALDKAFSAHPEIGHRVLVTGLEACVIQARIRRRIRNNDRFIFAGYVLRSELELLYREAYCFLYPTLNEGFGYPPVEAMKYGTPVIGSAITSIPEVYGDGILYFDPRSVHEMTCRILQIALDPAQREMYAERALATAQRVEAEQRRGLERTVEAIADPDLFR